MGKRKGPKRKVVIRWSNAAPPASHQIRVKPGGAKWKKWRTTTKPRTALRLKRGKVYRVAVTSTNAAGVSPVKTKRFRVKR